MSFHHARVAGVLAVAATLAGSVFDASPGFTAPIVFEDYVDYPAGRFPLRVTRADSC
jgi:hypothetical protein